MADEIEEEVFVPSGSQELSAQRGALIGMGASDVVGQSPENGEIGRPVILAVAGAVFVLDDVERPMQRVLDAPVGTHDLEQLLAKSGREARK